MKRTELNFVQKVWLESLWLGARVFAMMPYWFKYYIVENLLFFIIYYEKYSLITLFTSKLMRRIIVFTLLGFNLLNS